MIGRYRYVYGAACGGGCEHQLGTSFKIASDSVWLPAQALYDLRVAAGLKAKVPKYPGQIVTVKRSLVEKLRGAK